VTSIVASSSSIDNSFVFVSTTLAFHIVSSTNKPPCNVWSSTIQPTSPFSPGKPLHALYLFRCMLKHASSVKK
jgi:hypothetical protein